MRRAAIALLALALASPAAAGEERPTAAELESELVCPVCESTLDTSNAPVALRMKAYIRERIAAGDSKAEIKAKLVEDFGPAVLAVPPREGFDWVAWLFPLAGIVVAGVAVSGLAWRWSRARPAERASGAENEPVDPALERRIDDELDRFE